MNRKQQIAIILSGKPKQNAIQKLATTKLDLMGNKPIFTEKTAVDKKDNASVFGNLRKIWKKF